MTTRPPQSCSQIHLKMFDAPLNCLHFCRGSVLVLVHFHRGSVLDTIWLRIMGPVIWTMGKRVGCPGRPVYWRSFLLQVFLFSTIFFYGGARSLLHYIFFFGFPFLGSFGLLLLPLSTSIFLRIWKCGGVLDYVDLSTLVDSLFSGSSQTLMCWHWSTGHNLSPPKYERVVIRFLMLRDVILHPRIIFRIMFIHWCCCLTDHKQVIQSPAKGWRATRLWKRLIPIVAFAN